MNETLRVTTPTFPVTALCLCKDENNEIKDKEFLRKMCEKNIEFGFMNIYSGSTGTLSSCCRLRSDKNNKYLGYTNSFGGASTQIGSFGVVTLNLPRAAILSGGNARLFICMLKELTDTAIKINHAKRIILEKRIALNALPLYDYGFMNMQKQYATVGVNGVNEAITLLGKNILEKDGQELCSNILEAINELNDYADEIYGYAHNLEQTPSENSSIKLAQKDKYLGLQEEYELYSNQFIPLIVEADMLDRIKLQGLFDSQFSGGAIAHINIESKITDPDLLYNLILQTVKMGVVYHAINYMLQKCKNGHMSVGSFNNTTCPNCGEPITDNYSRIVGFLVNLKNAHKVRREHDIPNRQFYKGV